ncbi:MAG: hypothetical protein ACYCOU_14760 [Sulfobacillus sp.]
MSQAAINTLLSICGFVVILTTSTLGYISLRRKTGEIHVLVNSRLSRTQRRVNQLIESLKKAGVIVPEVEKGLLDDDEEDIN